MSGPVTYIRVEKITLNPDSILWFNVKTYSGDEIETTREFLHDPKPPDIAWIPTPVPDKQKAAADIPDKVLKEISGVCQSECF